VSRGRPVLAVALSLGLFWLCARVCVRVRVCVCVCVCMCTKCLSPTSPSESEWSVPDEFISSVDHVLRIPFLSFP
jgi:hypothetical protein